MAELSRRFPSAYRDFFSQGKEKSGNENFECELRNAARLIRKPGTAGNKLKRPETGKGQRIVSQLLPQLDRVPSRLYRPCCSFRWLHCGLSRELPIARSHHMRSFGLRKA